MTNKKNDPDYILPNISFWPPLNPDPACEHCGGTGYSRTVGPGFDVLGRCHCNVDRLRTATGTTKIWRIEADG
jgi:hypothetical protein